MGDESWRSCVIDANAMMNPEQLLIQIAEGFGLPQDSVNFGSGIEMLKKRLLDMKRSELVSLLVIDDAHELPAASLTMLMKLSELSDDNEGLLRIVLFSEPQLVEILNASALKDVRYRVTHTLEMPNLNEQETINYIQHRLGVAGLKDTPAFSKAQLKKIYRQSGGIPGKINLYAHEILLGHQPQASAAYAASRSSRLRSAISVLVIFAIALGITWFFTRDALDKLSDHMAGPDDAGHDSISQAQQTTRPLPLMPAKPLAPVMKDQSEKIPDITRTVDSTPAISVNDDKADKPVNAYALRQPDIQTKPVTTIDQPLPPAIKTTTEAETLASAQSKTDTTVTDGNAAVAKIPSTTKTVTVPASPKTKAEATVSKTTAPVTQKPVTRSWIERQNPKHFTLQVMGSREQSSITRVMRAHKLSPDKAAVLHTRLNNKDWYILVYGSYSTRDEARAAVSTLPTGLQLTKPWPRRIGDIKLVK
jgi:septal ring-binding cell division protein DamX